jgi:aspartate kinase
MIVLKFGGSSVQDASWIDIAINITADQIDRAPVLISSAMGKTTDGIIATWKAAIDGDMALAQEKLDVIRGLHVKTAEDFLTGKNKEDALKTMEGMFGQFASLIKGINLLKECSPRSQDTLLSFGERLSTLLIHHRILERGMKSELLDSRELVITDERFTCAAPLMDLTEQKIREKVKAVPGKILVGQGFIGSTKSGVTTTLGRGGSDYTASIYGACLDAEEVQIWTDVNGIMTTDPRIVKEARSIDAVTYSEAGELAYFGAKVVHPATIQPAVKKKITVYVKNTREPAHPGTAIVDSTPDKGVKAIACKKGSTVVSISSSRMLNAYGFLKNIFTIFDTYQTPVDLISTSEVSVSVTIDDLHALKEITAGLEDFGTVSVEHNRGIVCLVGQDLWKDSRFISRVFQSLDNIPIRMISLGSSDINLSLVVPEDQTQEAVIRLHKEFFPA